MTRLIELLISLAIVAGLMLVVAMILPSQRDLVEKVETNRKMTIVYDTLNGFRRFKDWNPLFLRDPRLRADLSGPESGVGARIGYDSSVPSLGKGSWEITATEPNKSIDIQVVDERRGGNKRMRFDLKPTGRNGRNVEISQSYHVEYGWDLIGRYAGLYVSRNVGDDMKLGLQRLSTMLASVPNIDYKVPGSKLEGLKVADRPAESLLVVKAGSIERNNEKIKTSMKANMEWIARTMKENGLAAAGPMRINSVELGQDNYTFEVAQPVRRGGDAKKGGDKQDRGKQKGSKGGKQGEADADAAGEQELAEAAQAPAGDAEELTGLKMLGPVEYLYTAPTRVATGSYTGYMAELENVRNAIRAWAMTQGFEPAGRPFELYQNGIDDAFTENGKFQVYWILKQP